MIQSGSVFVFDERESGIKRWTDGLVWSPSRILGNFLIYRELDKRGPDKKLSISGSSGADARQRSYSADQHTSTVAAAAGMTVDRSRERRLVGSLSDSYKFRRNGLIKKTMSIVVNGVAQHLISYYNPEDILQNRLRTPSSVPELASLEISPELLMKQNFRIPPMVEPTFENQGEVSLEYGDRRVNPLRSMSLGSLRSPTDPFHNSNMMYAQQQRMEMDQKPYNQVPVSMYNAAYPAMPSPTGIASSPGTPMLSPVRPSFQHQRHYSTSSVSSSSLPSPLSRIDSRNCDILLPQDRAPSQQYHHQQQQQHHQQQHHHHQQQQHHHHPSMVHPHIVPDAFHSGHRLPIDSRCAEESHEQQQQRFATNPNIGQLLNPVHPLHSHESPSASSSSSSSSHPNQALLHSMTLSNQTSYSDYTASMANVTSTSSSSSSGLLPTFDNKPPNCDLARETTCAGDSGGGGGGGGGGSSYHYHRQPQPLSNTQSVSLYQTGLSMSSSVLHDEDHQSGENLAFEPLMPK
ncbi:hypothetical protein DFQ28_000932 [Apophysomyces sp. BC1034]|nr:hypothetical protein DFQ28_000932 [Apophysomyces sp. BC1034]